MVNIQPNLLVAVTGASGYIAAWICQDLIKQGYRVRGSVRSVGKGEFLKKLLGSSFEYFIVEDVEIPGAFDKLLEGVTGVAHIASPFHFNVVDPHKDLINPAVNGTINLLKSALKHSDTIERVVFTSSFASVVFPTPEKPDYVFTELDWNEYSPLRVEELGLKVEPSQAYRASKVLAEKAAWEFLKQHTTNGKPPFELNCINPPLVFGPIIHQCDSSEALNTSVGAFYNFLTGKKADGDATLPSGSFVDVRDVSRLHIECLTNPNAGNKRYLVSTASFSYQPFLDLLHKPENATTLAQFPKCIKGIPGTSAAIQQSIDTSRAEKMFNWKPISMEKTIIDMANSLAERQKQWNA